MRYFGAASIIRTTNVAKAINTPRNMHKSANVIVHFLMVAAGLPSLAIMTVA